MGLLVQEAGGFEMNLTRDFVASVYVVNEGKVLLVHHKKLGMWLPVGGHIEKNELPTVCAIREAKEEAGLDIKIVGEEEHYERVRTLAHPKIVQLENIEPGHQHIDLIYFARLKDKSQKIKNEDKGITEVRWFSREELDAAPELVKMQAIKAIEELK
jgi:8-oxo-dGTP pyrophosphatase MutT (NUDIX family)